jgi:hypothetical protein
MYLTPLFYISYTHTPLHKYVSNPPSIYTLYTLIHIYTYTYRVEADIPLNPTTAGIYIAVMMAQIDVLKVKYYDIYYTIILTIYTICYIIYYTVIISIMLSIIMGHY